MTHPHLITDPAAATEFAFGGKARFTLVSKKTGKRYTFRVAQSKDNENMFFVNLLTGTDNESDYQYIGFLRGENHVFPGGLIAGRKGNPNHPAFKAFAWSLVQGFAHDDLEFWHEGRCARCARPLTDPASIERGLGPECANK